ncbi:MAG: sensor histidine kinase [Solirubrobacteraceae bacterium]
MISRKRLWAGPSGAREAGPPSRALQIASGTVWLVFLAFPLTSTFTTHVTPAQRVLAIAGTVVFVAIYLAIISCWPGAFWKSHTWVRFWMTHVWVRPTLYAVLLAVSLALTLGVPADGWGVTFIYCAACAALVTQSSLGFWLMLLCIAFAVGGTLIAGQPVENAFAEGAGTLGIGLMLLFVRDLRASNVELTEARAELARLAVVRERERFARDLHDLLGHTLSVIAIKTELARRLLPEQPARAATELGDIETVARDALTEVRQAVSGYRRPTLDGELAGARMALTAAGIDVDIAWAEVAMDPPVEAVLAWAVREGATNVIRHSRARHCRLCVTATLAGAGVEVLDDGPATAPRNGSEAYGDGHGLAGLQERVGSLGGTIAAGPQAGGGYRLAVEVPLIPRCSW